MTAVSQRILTVEEYLAFEHGSETRHEFIDGRLHAMAGETQEHEDIVLNITEVLRPKARGVHLTRSGMLDAKLDESHTPAPANNSSDEHQPETNASQIVSSDS
jgi:hypothetical protein